MSRTKCDGCEDSIPFGRSLISLSLDASYLFYYISAQMTTGKISSASLMELIRTLNASIDTLNDRPTEHKTNNSTPSKPVTSKSSTNTTVTNKTRIPRRQKLKRRSNVKEPEKRKKKARQRAATHASQCERAAYDPLGVGHAGEYRPEDPAMRCGLQLSKLI